METKHCVACAMDIRMEASKCPHCRTFQDGVSMHRGDARRTVGGVCVALARQFGLDVALVRVAFVLALVFSGGSALMVYLLLWVLTPASAHGKAPAQRLVDWLASLSRSEEPVVERRV
jgi:phage shock protein PspC (stress-responsive transcriptional regulator)